MKLSFGRVEEQTSQGSIVRVSGMVGMCVGHCRLLILRLAY